MLQLQKHGVDQEEDVADIIYLYVYRCSQHPVQDKDSVQARDKKPSMCCQSGHYPISSYPISFARVQSELVT